ncbi:hypothetical protein [Paraflavitalea sp. CAU 1676]|uniref:hypothetical protein n=1 Tax=Paraflavitalea sp. CAU 1676 TaxID=3032598 RepID=UPI0023DBB7D2|nr:hypothetical protein [Paraflavitalea sp. CAU 1676]MDF2193648.1 hypothetical protein [Paraflavitalea sp. CAU 1676]
MYANPIYVFRLEDKELYHTCRQEIPFYAICLVANDTPDSGATMRFVHPQADRSAPPLAGTLQGFSCLFNAACLSEKMQNILRALPMFRKSGSPVYLLNPVQVDRFRRLFEQMLEEVNNNYAFKYELLGNYLAEMLHQVLKLQPCRA